MLQCHGDTTMKTPAFLFATLLLASRIDGKSCGRPTNPPSSFNCSYNGACQLDGKCRCFSGWKGQYCQSLDLLPATNSSGLNLLGPPHYTSTWGGSVLYDANDGLYHMYASEISNHCGIHRWLSDSIVVHATSQGAKDGWKFERQEAIDVLPKFSHEPVAVRDPSSGATVLFVSHYPGGDASDCPDKICRCNDGSSWAGGERCGNECGISGNATVYSYFTYSSSKIGNGSAWSKLTSLASVQSNPQIDMNLAPVIREDGSLLAWTRWTIWEASNWTDPKTYRNMGPGPDFDSDPPTPWEGEDPSVWIDADGRYHMLSHNGDRGQTYAHNASGDCGRHYFSTNGKAGTWRVAPLLPEADLGGCAYLRTVPFDNAEPVSRDFTFYRRERPHLIFDLDGVTPVALSTAVIDSPVYGCDRSYTLVQPIKTHNGDLKRTRQENIS